MAGLSEEAKKRLKDRYEAIHGDEDDEDENVDNSIPAEKNIDELIPDVLNRLHNLGMDKIIMEQLISFDFDRYAKLTDETGKKLSQEGIEKTLENDSKYRSFRGLVQNLVENDPGAGSVFSALKKIIYHVSATGKSERENFRKSIFETYQDLIKSNIVKLQKEEKQLESDTVSAIAPDYTAKRSRLNKLQKAVIPSLQEILKSLDKIKKDVIDLKAAEVVAASIASASIPTPTSAAIADKIKAATTPVRTAPPDIKEALNKLGGASTPELPSNKEMDELLANLEPPPAPGEEASAPAAEAPDVQGAAAGAPEAPEAPEAPAEPGPRARTASAASKTAAAAPAAASESVMPAAAATRPTSTSIDLKAKEAENPEVPEAPVAPAEPSYSKTESVFRTRAVSTVAASKTTAAATPAAPTPTPTPTPTPAASTSSHITATPVTPPPSVTTTVRPSSSAMDARSSRTPGPSSRSTPSSMTNRFSNIERSYQQRKEQEAKASASAEPPRKEDTKPILTSTIGIKREPSAEPEAGLFKLQNTIKQKLNDYIKDLDQYAKGLGSNPRKGGWFRSNQVAKQGIAISTRRELEGYLNSLKELDKFKSKAELEGTFKEFLKYLDDKMEANKQAHGSVLFHGRSRLGAILDDMKKDIVEEFPNLPKTLSEEKKKFKPRA